MGLSSVARFSPEDIEVVSNVVTYQVSSLSCQPLQEGWVSSRARSDESEEENDVSTESRHSHVSATQ